MDWTMIIKRIILEIPESLDSKKFSDHFYTVELK